eukprot:7640017-Ditylum_brightwellii.AAC.1
MVVMTEHWSTWMSSIFAKGFQSIYLVDWVKLQDEENIVWMEAAWWLAGSGVWLENKWKVGATCGW